MDDLKKERERRIILKMKEMGVSLENYQGKYKGTEFEIVKKGKAYSWVIGSVKGAVAYGTENQAISGAKSAIDNGVGQ